MQRAGGAEYLGLVTDLLQRARLADPVGGLWEAADLQWWFTRDPHPGDEDAAFWRDDDGPPVTAVVFTRWGPDSYGCDVLGRATPAAWEFVAARAAGLPGADIDMEVDPGLEPAAGRLYLGAGFRPDVRTPSLRRPATVRA